MSKLSVSLSPHINTSRTTAGIMLDVLIALVPTSVAGIVIFGLRALAVLAVAVASAVLSEFLFSVITKRPQTVGDLSAAVTGLLLGLNLPYNTPLWQVVIGSVFAVICVKCIFGGIGQNFANPAITARIFMLVAFTSLTKVDAATGATPLATLKSGEELSLLDLFLGNKGGAIGEVCVLALIIGGIYLIIRRVINPTTPLVFIATTYLFTLALVGGDFSEALAWIMSGGLFIGAFFMATDYSTTPTTSLGKAVFGLGAGIVTVLIRKRYEDRY